MTKHLREEYSFFKKLSVWFGKKSIFVITMGKVGTLSICNSVEKFGYEHIHPHSLFYTWPGTHFIKVDLTFREKIVFTIRTFLKRIKLFIWYLLRDEIIIITGVRDPFSRYLSSYFEQIHYAGGIPDSISEKALDEDIRERTYIDGTIQWFDEEIKRFFNIDIYKQPFDKEKGYATIIKGKVKIFVYRLDKLNSLDSQIGEFLSINNFKIFNTNESSDNEYGDIYNNLKNKFKFDLKTAEIFCNSKYFNHFYTNEEIQVIRDKWLKSQ